MDCAREELAAFNQIITITSKNNNASENNVTAKSDDNDSVMRAQQTLKNATVQLITSRLLRAYELGYPTDTKLILK